jgi:hypothetical protein
VKLQTGMSKDSLFENNLFPEHTGFNAAELFAIKNVATGIFWVLKKNKELIEQAAMPEIYARLMYFTVNK